MSESIDIVNPQQPKQVAIVASNPTVSKQTGWPNARGSIRLALLSLLPTLALSQTIIPVDPKVPSPKGFRFEGIWTCGDGSTKGRLAVRATRRPNHRSGGLGKRWTEIIEKDSNAIGHYFVAYDRDKQEFVIIDAEDPAYAAYSTDGWHDHTLTLTPTITKAQSSPWDRMVYDVQSPVQFTISWELWMQERWNVQSVFTCKRK